MSVLPVGTQLSCNSYQNPIRVFVDIDKMILRFTWKDRGIRIANIILKKIIKQEETVYHI